MAAPETSRAAGTEALAWTLHALAGGQTIVRIQGEIDENADFSELARVLAGDVELDLEGVIRINSCGVREWVNFVRGLTEVKTLTFSRCPPTVVLQLNTIANFRGRARVSSFFAPYVCEPCHFDEYKLLDADVVGRPPELPAFACPRCGAPMLFDELPERYLSFLAENPAAPKA